MLVKTLKWRIEFKTDDLLNEEFPQDIFGNVGHIYGNDKEGRPITLVNFLNTILLADSLLPFL